MSPFLDTRYSITLVQDSVSGSRLRFDWRRHCSGRCSGSHQRQQSASAIRGRGSVGSGRIGRARGASSGCRLFGRSVGDSPVVRPVPSDPAVPFCEVSWNRACRPDHLIGNRLQRSGNPHHQLDRDSCCFEGYRMGNEVWLRGGVGHGHLRVVHALPKSWRVGRCQGLQSNRPRAGLPLTPADSPAISPVERPGGDHAGVTGNLTPDPGLTPRAIHLSPLRGSALCCPRRGR